MLNQSTPTVPPPLVFAHDLRNLLQTASSAISTIDRGTVERSQHVERAIAGARISIDRACELARRALSGMFYSFGSDETDVRQCLEEAASILQFAKRPGVAVELDLKSVNAVSCDRLALQNSVLNLAFNAIEAIVGDGRIVIGARPGEDAATVEISVSDDGAGMTRETVRRAFEPHFTTKSDGLGGVGLTTVETFARKSGGQICVKSELGVGTTVSMQLPAAKTTHSP